MSVVLAIHLAWRKFKRWPLGVAATSILAVCKLVEFRRLRKHGCALNELGT